MLNQSPREDRGLRAKQRLAQELCIHGNGDVKDGYFRIYETQREILAMAFRGAGTPISHLKPQTVFGNWGRGIPNLKLASQAIMVHAFNPST